MVIIVTGITSHLQLAKIVVVVVMIAIWILMKQEMMGWEGHQLDHV